MGLSKRRHGVDSRAVGIVCGFILGLFFAAWCRQNFIPCYTVPYACCSASGQDSVNTGSDTNHAKSKENILPLQEKGFLLIGVMSAQKYLNTRAVAAFNTWRKTINGKVVFFSSEGSTGPAELPIIGLAGTDDSYPPQKKSFSMLKYMHDHYIDKFEWFMRADDDVFIKGDRLEKFLRSVNSSKPQFIGQAGLGTKDEFGQLSLSVNENFCMGGPGIVFSRSTLQAVAPFVSYCLRNLYTTHEDVEIGRCVRRFVGISCTWAFEMQHIFFQNYREEKGSFKETLKSKDVKNAITLHPIKEPSHQYRVYNHLLSTNIMNLKQKEVELQREINIADDLLGIAKTDGVSRKLGVQPSLYKFVPKNVEEVLLWEFFSKPVFSYFHTNPRRAMEASFSVVLDDIIGEAMTKVNKNSRQRGRTIDYKETLYGYRRVNPIDGVDYILDLLMIYRKHKGRKMTVPVRRHAYLQQTFTDIEFRDDLPYTVPYVDVGNPQNSGNNEHDTIFFILPLSGRFNIFQRFLKNFEDVVVKRGESGKLIVVLYENNDEIDAFEKIVDLIKEFQGKYGRGSVTYITGRGDFARGKAIELGAAQCFAHSLLFFIDVDIVFTSDALSRIRLNTKQGVLAYFPIVFSQYDPQTVCHNDDHHCKIDLFDFDSDKGYWRQFGYGIASMYLSDLSAIGGFDTTIVGWGKEDVDLYQKVLDSTLTIFRSVDPGMVHAFHPIKCDYRLEPKQYQMCIGSKASSFGSVDYLARLIYQNRDLMNRNEKPGVS